MTVTTAFCVRGYCRIGSAFSERMPSTRIIRLTTVARTGRRMKISVNFTAPLSVLLVFWPRVGVVARLHRVVDDERRAVVQLDQSGGDDGVAFLDAGQHCHLIAARGAGRDEGL